MSTEETRGRRGRGNEMKARGQERRQRGEDQRETKMSWFINSSSQEEWARRG